MNSRIANNVPTRPVFLKKWALLLPLLALGASLLSLPIQAALPSRVFAPYIQMSGQSLTSVSQASGIKYFTLAFIVDDSTHKGTWEAGSSVASDTGIAPSIAALRSAGGDVIISFGGASGNELALGITSVSTLQSVYQGIINKYGVTALDFDIEGSAVSNTAANDRRNQALAGLQAANPGMIISYTLAVNPTGLDSTGIALLKNAQSRGVNVACVNIMAMDYGASTSTSMGQYGIDATNATISQLNSIGMTASIGITPLIGKQDTAPEVFTLSDAQTTENFAVGKSQVNRVTFWEVAIDQCGSSCSGVSQSVWQYSHIFEPFTGGSTTTTVATPVFSPAGGSYSSAQSVSISSTTSGASFRYTTDGITTPTATVGTIYSGPVVISSTTTLKAIAYLSGMTDSSITSAIYTISTGTGPITLEAESLSPVGTGATVSTSNDANASGGVLEFLNSTGAGQSMTLTTPSISAGTYQVQLRYKTNTTRGQHTVKIDGVQVGGTIDQYATTSSYQTATLGSITLGAGTHTIVLNVTGKNAAATQFYITADVFTLTPQATPQAAAPSFSPVAGTYTSAQSVTISTTTGGASIRYTTDGSTPTSTSGTAYSNTAVNIGSTTTLKAIAYEAGFTDSTVTRGTYTISGPPQAAAPVFTPGGGSYTTAQNVTITTSTGSASIHYTTDGSTPSETVGTVYSGPVNISSSPTTLKAIAYETGLTSSAVTSGTYTIGGTPPTFNFEAESLSPVGGGATVSISNDANASGGVVEFLNSTAAGQTITFTTTSMPAGTYQVQLRYKTNTTRGQHTLTVDGIQVGGTLDQYATTSSYLTATLGTVALATTGTHTIVMTVTGKNSAATQFYLTADKFTFIGQ